MKGILAAESSKRSTAATTENSVNPSVPAESKSIRTSRGSGPLAVSVVVPAYNAARFVGQAILSAQAQSLPPLEIIVVDDGSDDQTVAVVEREFPQVRLLTQSHRGVSAARNRGWRATRGALIAFLDADDFFLPGKLAAQVRLLESNRRLGVAHSGWLIADEQGHVTRQVTPWVYAPDLDLATWVLWKPVLLGAMVLRREWLERAGGFAEDLSQAEDVDLLLRLSCMGCRAAWVRQPTFAYRQHGEGTSRRGAERARGLTTALDRLFAQPALPHSVRRLERKARYYTALCLSKAIPRKWSIALSRQSLTATAHAISPSSNGRGNSHVTSTRPLGTPKSGARCARYSVAPRGWTQPPGLRPRFSWIGRCACGTRSWPAIWQRA